MGSATAGKTNLLTNKGSVYDLVAMFILLIGGDKEFANQILNLFIGYLNNGYTYQDIKTEILKSFYNSQQFRWNMFSKAKNNNLLTHGTRYYHKQLKLLSTPPVVERNIDDGTMVSRTPEYFLEPVASYTIQEFIQYFYQTMPVDLQAQPPARMNGIIKYKLETYGVDKLLFMTDIYAQDCKENHTLFNLSKWDDYSSIADEHLSTIKSTISENEQYYTPRKRRLFLCAK